jgi:galactofuranosylgalactofuranosylrhamnosyl-N-acetylglucosaminyl-diphospho-decaprenol beta-1,5/1,6-galactofuranosyltransferase
MNKDDLYEGGLNQIDSSYAVSTNDTTVSNGDDTSSNADDISLFDAQLDRYLLQEVAFNSKGYAFVPDIYFANLRGKAESAPDRLILPPGTKIGFNNYVNSFYASYWSEFTDLQSISLSGMTVGNGTLSLFRSTPSGKILHIGNFQIGVAGGRSPFHVHFDLFEYLPTDGGSGRFFFDIYADDYMEIERLAFCAFVPPPKVATFSLGVCTYRKEQYVTNLAQALDRYVRKPNSALVDVIFVNNDEGTKGLTTLKGLVLNNPVFKIVHQSNIGGAGGFTRTLKESLDTSRSEYHIFMDDDVYVDTIIFDRIRAFVSYSVVDHIVGGQMFNMKDPEYLYEGGAKLDYWGFLVKVGENLRASSHVDVTFFDAVREVDYNAWWFACVPKNAAKQVGMPLNIFIRGDDMEYGLRLKSIGIDTISLPGLFVWHEPFEGKTGSWLEYYNWRNRLILCSLHGDEGTLDVQPVDMLRDIIIDHIEHGRHELVFVMCLAILDYLLGPNAILGIDASKFHVKLRNQIKKIASASFTEVASLLNTHPLLANDHSHMRKSITINKAPCLGSRKRTVESIRWIAFPIVETVDNLLMIYNWEIDETKVIWKAEALSLSTRTAWTNLYGDGW